MPIALTRGEVVGNPPDRPNTHAARTRITVATKRLRATMLPGVLVRSAAMSESSAIEVANGNGVAVTRAGVLAPPQCNVIPRAVFGPDAHRTCRGAEAASSQ